MQSRTADSGMVLPTFRVALCPSVRLETPLRTYTDVCSMMTLAPVMFTISINHHRLVLSTWSTLLSLRINREIHPASAPPVKHARVAVSPTCIWNHLSELGFFNQNLGVIDRAKGSGFGTKGNGFRVRRK